MPKCKFYVKTILSCCILIFFMILVNNEAAPHRHQWAGVGRGVGVEFKFFKFGGRSDAKEDPSEEKGITFFLILGVWLTLLLILCLYLLLSCRGVLPQSKLQRSHLRRRRSRRRPRRAKRLRRR